MPGGGDSFLDAEEPSIELRFQIRDDQAHGYGRYHNGWFVGLGVRSGNSERDASLSSRRARRQGARRPDADLGR
jgi:hypothetical protein